VAAGDPDSLPYDGTIEAVVGYTLLPTDHNGWIKVTIDEKKCGSRWRNS